MSQSLKPRRPVSRRQRQPLSCVPDAFPMMAESPQLSSFVHDGESGAISAQVFVHVDKRVPFGSFRSFRAALTSMRHKKQDPVIELEGGRRYQAYATSIRVEGADDDIFTKHVMDPFALWAKWALRVQEASWSHAVFRRQQLYLQLWMFVPTEARRRLLSAETQTTISGIESASWRVDLCAAIAVMSALCWLIGFFDVSVVASCLGIVAGIAIADHAPESVPNKNSDEDADRRKTFVANEGDSEQTDGPVPGFMVPAGIDVESPATRTAGNRNTEDSEMQENPLANDERVPVFEQEENRPMAAGQASEEEEYNPLAAEPVSQPKGVRKKKTKTAGKKNAAQTSVTEEEDNPLAAFEPQPSAATSPEPARDGAGPVIPPAQATPVELLQQRRDSGLVYSSLQATFDVDD